MAMEDQEENWIRLLNERAALAGGLALAEPLAHAWPKLKNLDFQDFGRGAVFGLVTMLLSIGFDRHARSGLRADKGWVRLGTSYDKACTFWFVFLACAVTAIASAFAK